MLALFMIWCCVIAFGSYQLGHARGEVQAEQAERVVEVCNEPPLGKRPPVVIEPKVTE